MTLNHQSPRGFSLVELIVSVAIFAFVMVTVTAAYLALINLDRQARANNDVVNNLSFVIDSMTRAIRTGTHFSCGAGGDCPAGNTSFSFVNSDGCGVTYLITTTHGIGECIESQSPCTGTYPVCTAGSALPLSDPRVYIDPINGLKFYVQGTVQADAVQPQALITIRAEVKPDANTASTTFTIESQATQRVIDI